ncbi:hypothetical protein [Streptomyces collinus]|uniref:hypothetical protein n=1 Tax=Streptomyces collinus TaxID=42684 RepID=UPI003F4E2F12
MSGDDAGRGCGLTACFVPQRQERDRAAAAWRWSSPTGRRWSEGVRDSKDVTRPHPAAGREGWSRFVGFAAGA